MLGLAFNTLRKDSCFPLVLLRLVGETTVGEQTGLLEHAKIADRERAFVDRVSARY
jgi:hypothetical protein